ncbi:ABC transporter ATP-binding protein [Lachnospiraceae bacterium MD308]|nr:ABC transporter ATP-binding protein [Lachnospiraceae bacterium MD308]
MLRLENVRKQYKDFELDITMEVKPGYVTGLIGRNGAGKTTAFKAGLGLIRTEGEITLFGKPLRQIDARDREKTGVVLADSGFSGYLKVKDLVVILRNLYRQFNEMYFTDKCKEFDIPFDKQIKEFSTGMKRRLQVVAALSHNAELLIMDEPTAGMDVIARDELLAMLREYMETEGRSVLISSHISGDLEGICDDIYMIDGGKVIFHEETDVLLDQYGILKVTKEQYETLDKSFILRQREEEFGVSCLTKEKQFYLENYPDVVVEKGSVDGVMTMMIRGESR